MLNGQKAVVVGAPWATHLIVTARTGGGQRDARASRSSWSTSPPRASSRATIHGRRPARLGGHLRERPARAEALIGEAGAGLPLVEQVMDEAIAATCAEAVRRAAQAARGHAGIHQAAQAVRPADRRRSRCCSTAWSTCSSQVEQSVSMTYMATHQARRAGGRAGQGGLGRQGADRHAPAGSSARTPSSSTAAWA